MGVLPVELTATSARLAADLMDSDFSVGVNTGRWRIASNDGSSVVAEFRVGDGDQFVAMRINYDDYPAQAPAGVLWDLATNSPLIVARWPIGSVADTIFRHDWSAQNGGAPYAAWDRIAALGHPTWAAEHPGKIWHNGRTILHYFRETARVLEFATIPEQS
jgi:hypothetical protein